jgi:hypothetical protein
MPRKPHHAKVNLEAVPASLSFFLDGERANWRASAGKRGAQRDLCGRDCSGLSAAITAVETLDDCGGVLAARDARGHEESRVWPRRIRTPVRKAGREREPADRRRERV